VVDVSGFPDAENSPLVEEIMDAFAERFDITVETISTADENVSFPLPQELRAIA
jgi:4-hydroxy-3-methylbut-2-enyl diphosphate reductase